MRLSFLFAAALLSLSPGLPMPGWAQPPLMKPSEPVTLETFRDKNRVVVVYAPATEKAAAETFQRLWANTAAALRERDTVLLQIEDLKAQPAVARQLRLPGGRFTLVLIGKDGGEKFRAETPVAPETIFSQIDAMPMRRREMEEQRGKR